MYIQLPFIPHCSFFLFPCRVKVRLPFVNIPKVQPTDKDTRKVNCVRPLRHFKDISVVGSSCCCGLTITIWTNGFSAQRASNGT